MTTRITLTVFLAIAWAVASAQADLENLSLTDYLQAKGVVIVDGNAPKSEPVSAHASAKIAFQKSDSLLLLTYAALLLKAQNNEVNNLQNKIIKLQDKWDDFRKQHCAIVYDSYRDCSDCEERDIAYLSCLTELTDARIRALEKLYGQLVE